MFGYGDSLPFVCLGGSGAEEMVDATSLSNKLIKPLWLKSLVEVICGHLANESVEVHPPFKVFVPSKLTGE